MTSQDSTLRVAGPADVEAVTALVRAFRDHLGADRPRDDALPSLVARSLAQPDLEFCLAERGANALGYTQMGYRHSLWEGGLEAWLEDLFVLADARRGGTGRRLLEFALERARARGARAVALNTNEHNEPAQALYSASGFRLARESAWRGGREVRWQRRLLGALLALGLAAAAPPVRAEPEARAGEEPNATAPVEAVVLLHGLARSERAMRPLAETLAEHGYAVHNLDYPSTRETPAELVAGLGRALEACCREAERLHFVGHSLGGILIRAYLAEHRPAGLGRVVLLAPPNRGSELVDKLGDSWWFRRTFGPTGVELGTAPDSLPNRLPAPDYDVGVIAGTSTLNPVGSAMIPEDDDGAVAVERTRLEGAADFVTVERSHTFIMRAPEVAAQTIHFLRRGRFERAAAP